MAFIIAASCSTQVIAEWKKINSGFNSPPIHQDYALLKVLYHLRRHNCTSNTYINHIQWTGSQSPLNFNALSDDDVIYIAGHGNDQGLYAMGPNLSKADRIKNMDRLIDILTKDGSLKKKVRSREDPRSLKVVLLSCRAGVGFDIVLSQRLYKVLGSDLIVEGAVGFTFGSPQTLSLAHNEVLIYGLPWHMEYPGSIDLKTAEQATSNLESSSITYKRKKKEIDAFIKTKTALEGKMKVLVTKLKNIDVNKALDEIFANYKADWTALVSDQFDLYSTARVNSNLEFDMWFVDMLRGYRQTRGSTIRDLHIKELLKQPGVTPISLLSEK